MGFQRIYLLYGHPLIFTQASRPPGKAVVDREKQAGCLHRSNDLVKLATTHSDSRASRRHTVQKNATKSSAPKKKDSACRIQTSCTRTELILRGSRLAAANCTRGARLSSVNVVCKGEAAFAIAAEDAWVACSRRPDSRAARRMGAPSTGGGVPMYGDRRPSILPCGKVALSLVPC